MPDYGPYDPFNLYDPEEAKRRELFNSLLNPLQGAAQTAQAAQAAVPQTAQQAIQSAWGDLRPAPAALSVTPEQRMAEIRARADNPPDTTVDTSKYEDNPALATYRKLVEAQPLEENYKPSRGRRVLAAIAGGLAGASQGPAVGMQIGSSIASQPYEDAYASWKKQMEAQGGLVTAEQKNLSDKLALAKAEEAARNYASLAASRSDKAQSDVMKQNSLEIKTSELAKARLVKDMIENGKITKPSQFREQLDAFTDPETRQQLLDMWAAKNKKSNTSLAYQLATEYQARHPESTTPFTDSQKEKGLWPKFQQPPQALVISPEGQGVRVAPGTTVPQGSITAPGLNAENIAPVRVRTQGYIAADIVKQIPPTLASIKDNLDSIGMLSGRLNDAYVSKMGGDNAKFAKLDEDLHLLASAVVQAHYPGRASKEVIDAFMRDLTKAQSYDDLVARLDSVDRWMQTYARSAQGARQQPLLPPNTDVTKPTPTIKIAPTPLGTPGASSGTPSSPTKSRRVKVED